MDEAVVRIVLDSIGGGTTTPSKTSTPPSASAPSLQQPTPSPAQLTQPAPTQPIPVNVVGQPKPLPPPAAPTVPVLQPAAPPISPATLMSGLMTPPSQPYINTANLWAGFMGKPVPTPPPPVLKPAFDPQDEARKQYEREQQRKQIQEAYKNLYGGDEKESGFDALMKTAQSMRGAIGGAFGTAAGIGLDAAAAMGAEGATGAAGVLGSLAIAAVAVTKGFQLLNSEVEKSVSRYQDFSPDIAQAQAQADVRALLNDMRRAQENGPRLAEFINAQSKMEQTWEDIKAELMNSIVPILTDLMTLAKDWMEINPALKIGLFAIKAQAEATHLIYKGIHDILVFLRLAKDDDNNLPDFDPSSIIVPQV